MLRAHWIFLLLLELLPFSAHATQVTLDMRPNLPATAEYQAGAHDKPAILLLHGFLQTRESPTVATLARGLTDAGYSVLTPTLTLGIPGRRQSLACEAVHNNSLDDDLAEIDRWVKWLRGKGHRHIVLIGHSFGSLQLLAYLSGKPDPAVTGFVGVSLVEAQIGAMPREPLIERLTAQVARHDRNLVNYPLSYCGKYPTTPEALLSYVRRDQARTLAALHQLGDRALLVMGSADDRMTQGWLRALQHLQTPLVVIDGGNHFMDGEHEFDLLEHTLAFLQSGARAAAPHTLSSVPQLQ
jgi:pimeloyl-ACP methyl ester carboxylesterase